MLPVDDILESLDLSRAEPGTGYLEALFARFNAEVPFENASKILRNTDVADPLEKPRTAEIFWTDHLERGAGGTCYARVAAFDALLSALGFRTRRALGRVERDGDHAALLVETAAGESIVDVGFPLPAILPARPGSLGSTQGELLVEQSGSGFRVSFLEGVPEGPRSVEIFSAPVSEERFTELWRETFRPGARFLREVWLRRDLGSRILSFGAGEVRVDDLHSRLRVPVGDRREVTLAELFGIDADLLSRAFASAPATQPAGDTTLTAYLQVEVGLDEAFAAIATREGYARLLEGVAEVAGEERTQTGYHVTLAAPSGAGGASVEQEILTETAKRRIRVLQRLGTSTFSSSYRAEQRAGKTHLIREATLPGIRQDLLRNDSLRGRLAGTLAVDLLAWARML